MDFETLLARINREIELISETQHRLARQKALLQEQATRLRLGTAPAAVSVAVQEVLAQEPGLLHAQDWSVEPLELAGR
jgi:hypothetical protein